MRAGRSKDNALLRTIASKKNLNFASRRILRDLKEINDEKVPTVGVSARPLENSLFEWHGNLTGPVGTIYEGGIFHCVIKIPESYPHQPPNIHLCTSLPHENIFGQNICLDMLNPNRGGESQGWSSGYSIQSILIQLQSFLFQENFDEEDKKFKASIKKAIQDANNYKCRQCKHGGKLSAWPEVVVASQDQEKVQEEFTLVDFDEKKQFSKEIVCYHTKLSFKDIPQENNEDLKGVAIGVGLKITKVPRTGQIQNVIPTLDYVSIKAFIKEGIRWSVNNEKFSHFLPLYFGKEDNKDRALHLGRKALAMIMANNTRRFKPEFVLQVFPKIFLYQIFLIVEQKRHPSIVMIRQLAHIHANFLMFLEEYPELYDVIEQELQNFIKHEEKRVKDHTPNLAVLMAYLCVSPKTTFKDIAQQYHNEALDRQVFWIFKSVPELADEKNIESLNKERANLTFQCQITSNQMFCLFKHYLDIVRSQAGSPKQLLEFFEDNYCRLPNKLENDIQKGAFDIFDQVKNFESFYQFLGLKVKTLEELNSALKQAISNSKAKKYHGALEQIHTLPTSEEQIKTLLEKIPKISDFYNVKTIPQEEGKKKEFQFQIEKNKNVTEEDWKKACLNRWNWIREAFAQSDKQLSATQIAEYSLQMLQQGGINVDRSNNRLFEKIDKEYNNSTIENEKTNIDFPEHTWEQVFLKLDLEDALIYFDENPDFQLFYEKLEVMKDKIVQLTLPMVQLKNVKSGYHYITQVLTKLTNLQYLEVSGLPEIHNKLFSKAIKCIYKGMNNILEQKRSLQIISFYNIQFSGNQNEITDKMFTPLQQMKELISIRMEKTNLLQMTNAAKSLGNMITNMKNLQELILRQGIFSTASQAKEIADGLMRAKKLRYIDVSSNSSMGFSGLSAIIYNLAFAVNLYSLKVNNQQLYTPGTIGDVVEALFKLLKINSSLEILELKNVQGLNPKMSKDFFIHLGDIRTLRILNLQNSGKFSASNLAEFGKAIAFNAKKEGVLQFVDLTDTIYSKDDLIQFYKNMSVSEYDHEVWYGDSIKAGKMTGTDHDKVYYNNLKALQLNKCYLRSYFDLQDFQKYNRKDPELVKLYAQSKNLEALQLQSCSLSKNDTELLYVALDPTRENFASKIKVLNLSRNSIQKEGAKVIGQILEKNSIIEYLDISKNNIGVSGGQYVARSLEKNNSVKFLNLFNNKIGFDGAKTFASTLAVNNTLEFIEFGHNRIRDRGLIELGEGIAQNKNTKIHSLGLRFNFLREDGIIDFLKVLRKNTSLQELFVRNNRVNEYGLFQLKKSFDNIKSNINVDIFEKLKYLDESLLERTIYVHPIPGSRQEIKHFFEKTQHCGIVMDIRIRKGPKWPNRTQEENKFAMIEFADNTSVTRALTVASRKRSQIGRTRFRIYKAGTGTFIYQKKTSKQKKAETSKTNILAIDSNTHTRMWDRDPTTIYDRRSNNRNMDDRRRRDDRPRRR